MGRNFPNHLRPNITMPTLMNDTNAFVVKDALKNEFEGTFLLAFSFGFR
jgi:hypothetical protein